MSFGCDGARWWFTIQQPQKATVRECRVHLQEKQLREMDRRIRYLQKRLPELKVVRLADAPNDRVYFGATIDLVDDDYREQTYRIVGADEFDPARYWISIDSPMARALIGKAIEDTVEVQTPSGVIGLTVVEINYDKP